MLGVVVLHQSVIIILEKRQESLTQNLDIPWSIHYPIEDDNGSSSFPANSCPDMYFGRVLGSVGMMMSHYSIHTLYIGSGLNLYSLTSVSAWADSPVSCSCGVCGFPFVQNTHLSIPRPCTGCLALHQRLTSPTPVSSPY